jgi:hypothetical protein
MNSTSAESGVELLAKIAPPASITVASLSGIQVNEIILWATLIYTVLMIIHKIISMFHDISLWFSYRNDYKVDDHDHAHDEKLDLDVNLKRNK